MDSAELAQKWRRNLRNLAQCHYETSAIFKKRHFRTGIPLVVLSALANASLWTQLGGLQGGALGTLTTIVVSLIATAVTVLAAVQTFLGFEKRGEAHYLAGAAYANLASKIDLWTSVPLDDLPDRLAALQQDWNNVTQESPQIPLFVWERFATDRQRDTVTRSAPAAAS